MIGEALGFVAAAGLLLLVVWHSAKTGSLTHSSVPKLGSGQTTREKHPTLFWLGNGLWIGGAGLLFAMAAISVTDTIGLTNFFESVETENAPSQ